MLSQNPNCVTDPPHIWSFPALLSREQVFLPDFASLILVWWQIVAGVPPNLPPPTPYTIKPPTFGNTHFTVLFWATQDFDFLKPSKGRLSVDFYKKKLQQEKHLLPLENDVREMMPKSLKFLPTSKFFQSSLFWGIWGL